MALHRGIQSAIFYYLSCAPCAEARYRKKRKEEAKRDRADREALEADLPNLYRHPSPSSTNPYWQAEIALGPALESRGRRKPATAENQHVERRPPTVSSNTSGIASSEDLSRKHGSDDRYDSKWNFRLHQREDEELWGSRTNLNGSVYGESIRRPATARTKDSTRSNFQSFRNPPINDLHPATVTNVTSREDVMWMLQPPPVAEVMSGKEKPSRSRSNSASSRPNSNHPSLQRQTSSRFDSRRLQVVGKASPAMSRESSTQTVPNAQQYDEDILVNERDFAADADKRQGPKERQRASPSLLPAAMEQLGSPIAFRPSVPPDVVSRPTANRAASRPQLSTIASASLVPTVDQADRDALVPGGMPPANPFDSPPDAFDTRPVTPPHDRLGQQSSTILVHESSLKLVQDLHPGSGAILNTHVITATTPSSPIRTFHPNSPYDSADDSLATATATPVRPELFDSWHKPDFELPEWVAEHTKREVQQRWSMDL